MRIAFVAETLGCPIYLGGISRYTYVLGLALTELGHEVHVYTMAPPEEWQREIGLDCPLRFHHVRRYAPSLFGYRTLYYRLLRECWPGYCFVNEWAVPLVIDLVRDARRGLLDIIEAPETGGRIAIGTKLLTRYVPVVGRLHSPSFITAQGSYAADSLRLKQVTRMEAMFARNATAISAPSRAVADLVRRRFGVLGDIRVIGNPVPRPTTETFDIRGLTEKRVVFVGRFEPLKGFDTLLRAMPKIQMRVPDVIFDLIGPDLFNAFEHGTESGLRVYMTADEAKAVAPRIRIHGELLPEQADEIRARATCAVVPSTFESFSFTLTEAMALGRPVVASRAGALLEIVEHGRSGLLVEVGADEALAAAVTELLLDPEKAHSMGREARIAMETRFAPSVIAARMEDFYATVCATVKSEQ